jgi:mRNA-degrading endonuclease HigB of HigAB toxin-antitoxin module
MDCSSHVFPADSDDGKNNVWLFKFGGHNTQLSLHLNFDYLKIPDKKESNHTI